MYKITKKLGNGNFASVYQLQTSKATEYAVKVVRMWRRDIDYLKEARIMMKLVHPHLVHCYTYFQRQSTLYLILECAYGTLQQYIEHHREAGVYVEESTVLGMLCQLADVLRYLYAMKIIHRDLKTENVFLDDDRNVKVGDVGIARELTHTSEEVEGVAGTLFYMSPEVRDGKSYSGMADIWSAGCCFHETMTLHRTFDSFNSLFQCKIPELPRKYSSGLRTLVLQMLSEDPLDRPDAYQVLCTSCELRKKPYKAVSYKSMTDFAIDEDKVHNVVTKFVEYSCSQRETDDNCGQSASGDAFWHSSMNSSFVEQFDNLKIQRDTFGTLTSSKDDSYSGSTSIDRLEASRSLTRERDKKWETYKTGSSGGQRPSSTKRKKHSVLKSKSAQNKNRQTSSMSSADVENGNRPLSSLSQTFNCSSPPSSTYFVDFTDDNSRSSTPRQSGRYDDEEVYDRQQNSSEDVTLYTRAQQAKYDNTRGRQTTQNIAMNSLARSTRNLFSDQSPQLQQLMLKRVMGHQNYAVDGNPMLQHPPF